VSFVTLVWLGQYVLATVRRRRLPYLVVPLFWLWAMLHGLWFAGLCIVLGTGLGLAVDTWRTQRRFALSYLAFVPAALIAVALTPAGPALWLSPFDIERYGPFVSEWQPPRLTDPVVLAALCLPALVLLKWLRRGPRPSFAQLGFVAASIAIGMLHYRTIPVLVACLTPMAAEALRDLLPPSAILRPPSNRGATKALLIGCVIAVVGVLVLGASTAPISQKFPTRALHYLDALPGHARVLNEYGLGGAEIYWARDTSPAIDGRAELYDFSYFERYMAAQKLTGDWKGLVTSLSPDAAWLPEGSPLANGLSGVLHWRVVLHDGDTVILLPPQAVGGSRAS
jgi:hypothetical protein